MKRSPLLLIKSAFQLFHASSVKRHKKTYSALKGNYAELWNASIFLFMSVLLRGTTRMPLEKLLWNIISEYISTICRDKWKSFTILKACRFLIYLKIYRHLSFISSVLLQILKCFNQILDRKQRSIFCVQLFSITIPYMK